MPEYLLPCECGEHTIVSTAQAGETVRCVCGNELQVPTMRGLQELEPLERATAGDAKAESWDDRHRVAFLLVLGALTCVGVAIYLWASLPAQIVQPTNEEFNVAVDAAAPGELMLIHKEAATGRLGNRNDLHAVLKIRQMMLWGMGIVLALGVAALGCAGIVLFNRPRARR